MCGTVATQLFGGILRGRCFYNGTDEMMVNAYGEDIICHINDFCLDEDSVQGECIDFENPNFGVTSFDNIFKSILNVFIIITLEGWTDTMYTVRMAMGTYSYDIFFVACVVFGTFFVLNLMIAV